MGGDGQRLLLIRNRMRPAVRRDDAAALSTSSADRQTHRERRMAMQHASMRTRQRVHSITTTPRRLLHWRCALRRRRCWPPQFSCACGRFTQKELPSNAYEHSYIHTNRCLRPRRAGAGGNVQGHCAAASPWRAVPRALLCGASRRSRWQSLWSLFFPSSASAPAVVQSPLRA